MPRRKAAAQAALLLLLWESFINDKYLKEACNARMCRTCNSHRVCNNHFCLQCKTGGLCPMVFREGYEHDQHPWLQVRRYSRRDSVLATDLALFISEEGLKHIQTNMLNEVEKHCFLRTKEVAESSSSTNNTHQAKTARTTTGEKSCGICQASIRGSNSKDSNETFLVCSLQCLLNVARDRPELNLLRMKDGAMEPRKPPMLYTEKLSKRFRVLETPSTEIPIDEALDFLMRVPRKPRTVKPTVAAQALPQATEDFPMSGSHDSGPSVTSILEALPFPFAPEDYPMFGTPAETSLGEALPFPPVIEDFSMLDSLDLYVGPWSAADLKWV